MSNVKNLYASEETIEVPFTVSDTSIYRLSAGRLFTTNEIWTGAGKTGTQLTSGTDYSPDSSESSAASQIKGESVYSGFVINNASYHDIALFATINYVGNIPVADLMQRRFNESQPIASGDILIYDGTGLETSEGASPVEGKHTVQRIPSRIPIDDTLYDNPNVKWPGERGALACYGEYENLIKNGNDADSWTDSGTGVSSQAGDWVQVDGGATPATAYAKTNDVTLTGAYKALCRLWVQKVSTATVTTIAITGIGAVDITWGTGIVYTSPSTDIDGKFLDDGTAELIWEIDSTAATNNIRVYPDQSNANAVVKVKDALIVDFASATPFKIPYFEGVSPATKIQHSLPDITACTLEKSIEPEDMAGECWVTNISDGTAAARVLTYIDAGVLKLEVDGTVTTGSTLASLTEYNIKTILQSDYTVLVYLDGVLDITDSTTATTWAGYNFLDIGCDSENTGKELNGLFFECHYRPSADTSTTHDDLDVPWINEEKEYNETGAYSLDQEGNMTVNQVTDKYGSPGDIIFDAEIGGVWVTKWRGGRMEQSELTGALASGSTITFPVPFTAIPAVNASPNSGTNDQISHPFSISANSFGIAHFPAVNTAFSWHAIGRWK